MAKKALCHKLLSEFIANDQLLRVSHQLLLSDDTDDKGGGFGTVHIYPAIYLMAEDPGIPQLEDH